MVLAPTPQTVILCSAPRPLPVPEEGSIFSRILKEIASNSTILKRLLTIEPVFTSGKHCGQTFQQVAREDPSYHLRCRETGYSLRCPDTNCMNKYVRYFRRYGDQLAAVRGERDAIKSALVDMGIYPDCGCLD